MCRSVVTLRAHTIVLANLSGRDLVFIPAERVDSQMDQTDPTRDDRITQNTDSTVQNIGERIDHISGATEPTVGNPEDISDASSKAFWLRVHTWWAETDPTKRVEILIAGAGLLVLIVYTFFSALQWSQIRYTNRLTARALDGSSDSLNKTLGKMQGQIDSMNLLATNAGTQATQTTNLATDTQDLAQTSKNALESVQRAFVFVQPTFTPVYKDATNRQLVSVQVQPSWSNAGVTPTRNFILHGSQNYMLGELPAKFAFPDEWDAGVPHVATPSAIGPKGTIGGPLTTLPLAAEESMADGKVRLFMWGWGRYNDIFPKTSTHLTEYCWEVKVARISGTSGSNETFSTNAVNCPAHNCYDDECKSR